MKFWFCERCGARLTEADLEAGRAKNKEVKGVYCADCAAGVMTMAFQTISNAEARKILKAEEQAQPAKNAAPKPLPRTEQVRPHEHRSGRVGPAQPRATWIVVAAASLPLALIGVLFLLTGKAPARPVETSATPTQPPAVIKTPPAETPSQPAHVETPVATPGVSPESPRPDTPAPEPASAEARADAAFAELSRKLAAMQDPAQKRQPLEAFLQEYAATPAGRKARSLLDDIAKASQASIKQPVVETPAQPVRPKLPAAAASKIAARKAVAEAYTMLRTDQVKPALDCLEAARKAAGDGDERNALGRDIDFAHGAEAFSKAFSDGAALLVQKQPAFVFRRTDGKDVPCGAGTKAAVKSFKDGVFIVEQDLGGAFATHKIALSSLQPATRNELTRLGLAGDPDAELKAAFAELLAFRSGANDVSADQLRLRIEAAAKSGASAERCAHLLARVSWQAQELQAESAFAKLKASREGVKSHEFGDLIGAFSREFGETLVYDRNHAVLEQWFADAADGALKEPGPVTDAWVAAVSALPAAEQFKYVDVKLLELNPRMKSLRPIIEGGKITGIRGSGANISKTAPLRALTHLRRIDAAEHAGHEGIFDLAPLKALPLTDLILYNLRVPDLSPLRGSSVARMNIGACPKIKDYSPLADMPQLAALECDLKPSAEAAEIVRKCKALKRINGMSVEEFLKRCGQ